MKDRMATAVTSMTGIGDTIYLGLTGGSHVLAKMDAASGNIELCTNVFPWLSKKNYCTKIHNAMGALDDNTLLIGEGNHFTWDGLPVYSQYLKSELPEFMLQRKKQQGFSDIRYEEFCLEKLENWDRERDDRGGKIVKYNTISDTIDVVAELPKYCYVQSMVVDAKRNMAYGNTIPDNHFFVVDLKNNILRDYGRISEYAHHNMVVSPKGICYGGWLDAYTKELKLLKFNPKVGRLEYTNTVILKDVGAKIAGNQGIDQWLVTKNGEIYVGIVSNSLLFRFDEETETFDLLGQPDKGGRIAVMEEDDDGIIWIGAGYPKMHLARFDKTVFGKERFYDCGEVNTSHSRCYFHSSYYYKNKIYLGETDGFSPSVHVVDLKTI